MIDFEQLRHEVLMEGCENERQRLAREIHDQVIQALIGLNYQISHLRVLQPADLDKQLAGLQCQIGSLTHTVRNICANLRPTPLDLLGVMRTVREVTTALDRAMPFSLTAQIQGNTDVDICSETAICLVRALQEALMNVQKHAAAHNVSVLLRITPETITLVVRDDGVGFALSGIEAHAALGQHFGLHSMRERVERVGGRMEIASMVGDGTSVEVRVPCTQ